jgi:hypothetical protein
MKGVRLEVRQLLKEAIEALENPEHGREEYDETIEEWVRYQCFAWMRQAFEGLFDYFFREQSSAIGCEDWRVDGFMVGWSGVTYWAKDAEECVAGIVSLVEEYELEVCKLL